MLKRPVPLSEPGAWGGQGRSGHWDTAAFPPAGCEPLSGRSPVASGTCRSRCTYFDDLLSGVGGGQARRPMQTPQNLLGEEPSLPETSKARARSLHPDYVSCGSSCLRRPRCPGSRKRDREMHCPLPPFHGVHLVSSLCFSHLLSLGRPRVPLSALLSPHSSILSLTPLL